MSPRSCQRLLAALAAHHPEHAPHMPDTEKPKRAKAAIKQEKRPTLRKKSQPDINDITAIVAWFYRISVEELMSDRRFIERSWPRQVVFYLAREMITSPKNEPLSYPGIAHRFGFDHTSVMHGCAKIRQAVAVDERLADEIEVARRHVMDAIGMMPSAEIVNLAEARPFFESRLYRYNAKADA